MDRTKAAALREKVGDQLDEALSKALLPARPQRLTLRHVSRLLRSIKTAGRGPTHGALWDGLWRAIIFDRDNYTCYFCHRSGEEGVTIRKCQLALRLQLDHLTPRSFGGADYKLSNIRTACRICNQGRFRLPEEYFRAEMLSLASSVCDSAARSENTMSINLKSFWRLSHAVAAARLGVSVATIKRWRRSRRPVGSESLPIEA